MTTPEGQEKIKEEAKALRERIEALVGGADARARIVRTTCIYAGLITETLLEYEEPDVVMEQAFHRVADLLRTDPEEGGAENELMPLAYDIDHDTELGRHLARGVAPRLSKNMDDIHEIAIALVINDFPSWEKEGFGRDKLLRLLIETVIASLTYEMATQDFCDLLIEEYMADGNPPGDGILAMSAVAGYYLALAQSKQVLPADAEKHLTNVMAREAIRHNTPGVRDWTPLSPANDPRVDDIPEYFGQLKPQIDEFFVLIGMEDLLGRAVAVAKAVGRMIAVITVEDIGQIHPSIAKSLAKTGMILGARYGERAKA